MLNFIIIAFVLFLVIRAVGRLITKEAEKARRRRSRSNYSLRSAIW